MMAFKVKLGDAIWLDVEGHEQGVDLVMTFPDEVRPWFVKVEPDINGQMPVLRRRMYSIGFETGVRMFRAFYDDMRHVGMFDERNGNLVFRCVPMAEVKALVDVLRVIVERSELLSAAEESSSEECGDAD